MKAVGQFAGGINAYNAGKYTRSVMQTNAQNVQNSGVAERDRVRAAASAAMGQQVVNEAGSGFQTGSGSALDMLKQSAINRELDLAVSRSRASMAATGMKQQGDMAYAQGKSAEAGGILAGAATIAEQIAGAFGGGAGGGGDAGGGFGGGDMPVNIGSFSSPSPSGIESANFGALPQGSY